MSVNVNAETGIRFGVISGNSLDPDVFDDLYFYQGTNVSYEEARKEAEIEFGREWDDLYEQAEIAASETDHNMSDEERERFIERWFEEQNQIDVRQNYVESQLQHWVDNYEDNEPTIEGEYEGVSYGVSWLGGAPLVWVFQGPTGYVNRLCSPCVPGAADLDSGFVLDNDLGKDSGYFAYVVPADWLRKED